MTTIDTAKRILEIYGRAWMTQDPELILTIFTHDATYHERAFKRPFTGHDEIRQYWQEKVVEEQSDIVFKLLNIYIDGDRIIAEWDATFNYKQPEKSGKKHMKEVAILELEGDKIQSLREYWQVEEL